VSILDRYVGKTSRAALALMTGRTFGFAAAFGIPIVLVRVLDQQSFGTYKYLFMLASTLNVLQLGMAESLYYFVPRRIGGSGHVVANGILTLGAIGAALVVVMTAGRHLVAGWAGQPGLAAYLPMLGAFVGLSLTAMPLEIVMVSRQQYRSAATTYAASDVVRASLLALPGLVFRSLTAVMWGAVTFAALRGLTLLVYLSRSKDGPVTPDRGQWREQFAYACPFAIAVIIETLQLNLHQYVVWAKFDPATFAIYAAGCLQIPVVDLLTTSVGNVMMVRMASEVERPAVALQLWHHAVDRLACVLWPLTAALILSARDVIVLLFTARYAASVPIFIVSTLAVALTAVPVDSVLRVYARTRFLIVMNLIRLGVVVGGIGWAIGRFHLLGAIGITVTGLLVAKAVAIWRIADVLETPVTRVLPWSRLARTAVAVGVAVLPVLWLRPALAPLPVLFQGAAIAGSLGIVYLAVVFAVRGLELFDGGFVRTVRRVVR
jgi:O-antigen/teichoic acid export membrane protein